MKNVTLGSSGLQVSEVCLGTMTWGLQNTESEAHQQIDYALERGVNFLDTAEMYPVPPSSEKYGLTEQYIGTWLQKNPHKRTDIILASKIAGIGVPWVRNGEGISGKEVILAVDRSLQRLQTDYLDLFQLHWINRSSPHFSRHWPGMINYASFDVEREKAEHLDILSGLDQCVKAGKIRHCGLSNETPWGINQYLQLAKDNGLPRMVSVQNEFNLLHLTDLPHVMETCVLEDIAYLPWSPLAGGALSGKYRNGAKPEGCRWTMQQRNGIFRDTTLSHLAIEEYYQVAKANNLSLAQLSLAWVNQYHGVTSTIIGATSMQQLAENIDAFELSLDSDMLAAVERVYRQYPVPF